MIIYRVIDNCWLGRQTATQTIWKKGIPTPKREQSAIMMKNTE